MNYDTNQISRMRKGCRCTGRTNGDNIGYTGELFNQGAVRLHARDRNHNFIVLSHFHFPHKKSL